jgi:phosphohistidine phosphatase
MILNFELKPNDMKTLYLIRHAKSSWSDSSLRDKDRPLNSRGLRDAPFMAKMLKGRGVQADAIISSPANRAFTTATYFAKEMEIAKNDIIQEEDIYEAYTEEIHRIIHALPDQFETVLLFGHNPTFTSVANQFTGNYINNVPTCGVVQIESSVDKWINFKPGSANLTGFFYPKQYF